LQADLRGVRSAKWITVISLTERLGYPQPVGNDSFSDASLGFGFGAWGARRGIVRRAERRRDHSSGGSFACAVVAGSARCWGNNDSGQLGNDSVVRSSIPVPVRGLESIVSAVSAGAYHSCAVVDGAAWCWGDNQYGQLGDGSTLDSLVPVRVAGLTSGVSAIASGTYHTCAIVKGRVRCWGHNDSGQLGLGDNQDSLVPMVVTWPL
ncbi:MAG TPA: hypothetical protein VFQ61_12965, partial [Polyangiaceae bacterium]|nr:hypothetical protein [Polyangiaceae bacterium]